MGRGNGEQQRQITSSVIRVSERGVPRDPYRYFITPSWRDGPCQRALLRESATRPLVLFDLETTGLPSRGPQRALQLAALRIEPDGVVSGRLNMYIRQPGWAVDPEITRLTGITQEAIDAGPTLDERDAFVRLDELARGAILASYNLDFDLAFVEEARQRHQLPRTTDQVLCVLRAAQRLVPRAEIAAARAARGEDPTGASHKLVEMSSFVRQQRPDGGGAWEQRHDAADDTRHAVDVLHALREREAATPGLPDETIYWWTDRFLDAEVALRSRAQRVHPRAILPFTRRYDVLRDLVAQPPLAQVTPGSPVTPEIIAQIRATLTTLLAAAEEPR